MTDLQDRPPELLSLSISGFLQELREAEQFDFSHLPEAILSSMPRVFTCSQFIAQQCVRQPARLSELVISGDLLHDYKYEDYVARLATLLGKEEDNEGLMRCLRQFRQREWIRIVWRDIAGWAELEQTTRDLSRLAEACVDAALHTLYGWACAESGTPYSTQGEPQQLVVIGMGKLGAWELNVSSDIDLIFAYPEAGETRGADRPLSNTEFFTRLGQKLIQALDAITADGFVFRVDMRLRPFGEGGPLVASFDAMESYYQAHGREWERYAMIKARVIAGDREAGKELMARLKPFVYRRYLDYGAYESLREMKAIINREIRRKGIEKNIKLGPGGIREVEFIGQVFQLIRGGQEPALQERRILLILAHLKDKQFLPAYVIDELCRAYRFLRTVEHRLQAFAEQQTHNLPTDELGRLRIAYGMGFADWESFHAVLAKHRHNVQSHFEQVFEAPQTDHEELDLTRLWFDRMDSTAAESLLAGLGYADPKQVYSRLQGLRTGRLYRAMSAQGQGRLDKLIPLLVGAIGQSEQPDVTFSRVLALIEAISRRSVYLVLLTENPMALSQLVRLCAASPWIARYLTQYPMLLDELMDTRSLYAPPDKAQLAEEIRDRLADVSEGDEEQLMDTLRHFHHLNVLRVAAADIVGSLPLMKVSDHLTWIAEVCLDETLELAWRHMTARHGRPVCTADGRVCDKGFAVIGYGKLGGLELGYGSDLDLVFVHGADRADLMTDGPQPIAASVFFARLGQRLIHLLTAMTRAGVLYEVDMRLRPDGAAGMLVSSLKSFIRYQQDKAWTWEHQALVRARFVAGDPLIAEQFLAVRGEVLGKQRDKPQLRQEVLEMRDKMRKELDKSQTGEFDLKQGRGGIVDIEFMVQYGVLAWAHEHPELLTWTDNIRLLMVMAATGVMPAAQTDMLTGAYQTYRGRLHRLTLAEHPGRVPGEEYEALSRTVTEIWQDWMLADTAD